MKKWLYLLYCLILTVVLLYPSCSTDNSTPQSTDDRTKFTGTWNVSETYTKSMLLGNIKLDMYYQVTIKLDTTSKTGVLITNFGNAGSGITAKASVSGNSIAISPANQTLSNDWVINGSGTMTGTTLINWNYTIDTGADIFYATAKYSK